VLLSLLLLLVVLLGLVLLAEPLVALVRVVRVNLLLHAPEFQINAIPRFRHFIHLPRRPRFTRLDGFVRVPLKRGFFVRLFNKVASPVFR
jgi:hypothetical protein